MFWRNKFIFHYEDTFWHGLLILNLISRPFRSGRLRRFLWNFWKYFLCRNECPSLSGIQHRWTQNRCETVGYHSLIYFFQIPRWVSLRADFCFLVFFDQQQMYWSSENPDVYFDSKCGIIQSQIQHEPTYQCCTLLHTSISSNHITGQRPKSSDFTTGKEKKFDYSPQSAGSVVRDNQFSVQLVPGSFAGGKAARTRGWPFNSSWYRAKISWSCIFTVPYACSASCFINWGKRLPLSCLLFVFVFLCVAAQ